MQNQRVVSANFASMQILPFSFVGQQARHNPEKRFASIS